MRLVQEAMFMNGHNTGVFRTQDASYIVTSWFLFFFLHTNANKYVPVKYTEEGLPVSKANKC